MAYQAVGFNRATRMKVLPMPNYTRPSGGGLTSQQLPRSDILAGIQLNITGTVGGTVGTVNAWGNSSIIRRIRVTANSGQDIINITGPGYSWLLQDQINLGLTPNPQSTGRNAVTATAVNLD